MVGTQDAKRVLGGIGGALILCAAPLTCARAQSPSIEDLRSLSLEELSQVNISSVTRRSQPIQEAPAAAYVITAEDIRRSGATTLPEALRMAPNLNVGRNGASTYAISARGFNSSETSNKLLVMIDSRSVYHPLFAGVFWEEEHVVVEDIERIEVISGPGGALWGANAVNGVINVITRNSDATQGPAGRVTYGALNSTATTRFGGRLGGNGSFRVFGSAFDTDNTWTALEADGNDDYNGVFGGFRSDWTFGDTNATFDVQGFDDNIADGTGDVWGGFARGRVSHSFQNGHRLFMQAYYDSSSRKDLNFDDRIETGDITFQHTWAPMGRHQIIWGGGYRYTQDHYFLPGLFKLDPPADSQELANAYLQDTITLNSDLNLDVGLKLEDSSFSGFEYLPSARMAWTPSDSVLLWAAVSRAVRTPVRLDRDLVATNFFIGGPMYKSEELVAYEVGYRGRPSDRATISVSLFANDYDDLRTTTPLPGFAVLPAQFTNDLHGLTYGVEAWGDYRLADWWVLRASLSTLGKDFKYNPGVTMDIADPPSTGNDPDYQAMLGSRMNLTPKLELDANVRWVDELPSPGVPEYVELDARIGYQLTDALELSIVGTSLLHEDHPETSGEGPPFKIRRGVFVGASWGF